MLKCHCFCIASRLVYCYILVHPYIIESEQFSNDKPDNFVCILIREYIKKIRKNEMTMEVGYGFRSNSDFVFGKSSQNSPILEFIFWDSIPCVFCVYVRY